MSKNVKFGLLIAVVLGALGYLMAGGVAGTATYSREIAELKHMGSDGTDKRIQVSGDILANSIVRDGSKVYFTLTQGDSRLNVIYTGSDSLPDTFHDGSQAVAEGKMDAGGVFYADKVRSRSSGR